jgi:alanyl-tRNA synthetase
MTSSELRQKYLDFFKSKGHAVIPSASLIPENDPTVLFTTAGMHPLVPYLMGEKHPSGTRLTDAQKCIRTGDIDEVGDTTHHTFFEMMGNWSLGEYFKEDAIKMSWEFLTSPQWLGLDKNRLAVSVFAGDADAPFDQEAFDIWKGIFEANNLPVARIAKLPKKNNWWGPAGVTGPCGPDTEMFYFVGGADKVPASFNDDNDLWVEIWNDVFMQFNKDKDGKYELLKQRNVDTGMGLERTLAVVNGLDDNYKTDLFWPIIEKIEAISGKKYNDNKKEFRIIADHIKASVFIIADGIVPSNVERGYVVRRLLRRAIRQGHTLGVKNNFIALIAKIIQDIYRNVYREIFKEDILRILEEEEDKFRKTLEQGLKLLKEKKEISGEEAFNLFQTYGFPIELTLEFIEGIDGGLTEDEKNKIFDDFNVELKKHQELSRTASAGMFKGGLADAGEETTKLHTVAHLMLAGLRKVLGDHIYQKGSNITAERLRFDFSHTEKMTEEQKKAVEDFVNEAIKKNIPVVCEEMELDEAKKQGAMGVFENKYGAKVKVYSIEGYSKEICGGPHVNNTGNIHGTFKIQKEESSSSGVRRIKAVIE